MVTILFLLLKRILRNYIINYLLFVNGIAIALKNTVSTDVKEKIL